MRIRARNEVTASCGWRVADGWHGDLFPSHGTVDILNWIEDRSEKRWHLKVGTSQLESS